jgi:hypothetical protein
MIQSQHQVVTDQSRRFPAGREKTSIRQASPREKHAILLDVPGPIFRGMTSVVNRLPGFEGAFFDVGDCAETSHR